MTSPTSTEDNSLIMKLEVNRRMSDEHGCGCCCSEQDQGGNHWQHKHHGEVDCITTETGPEDEVKTLQELKADLEKQLETVNERLEALKH